MSLFSKILDKLGLNKEKEKAAETAQAQALADMAKKEADARAKLAAAAKPVVAAPKPVSAAPAAPVAVPAKPYVPTAKQEHDEMLQKDINPKPIAEVDVVKHLEEISKGKGLDWKVSIVDLLKLLELDSSREARIELAKELGCPPELMGGDLAKMNVWLHKTVLKKIAENGGNIPAALLD